MLQGTSGGISRVRKQRQTCLRSFVVQFFEAAFVHVNFPARFEKFRCTAVQSLWNGTDRLDVLRDLVARNAIAAGGGMAKASVLVQQRNSDAVHFGLDHNRNLLVWQEPGDSRVEISHLFFGISIAEAQHRRAVLDLRERFERFSTNALGGRIWRDEIWELRLQIDQLLVEPVVFAVADYRRGFLVVEPVVFADFFPQLLDTLRGLRLVVSHETRYKRAKTRQW